MTTDGKTVNVKTEGLHGISYADALLMQNLLWTLVSEGVLPKEKISGMIGGCIDVANSAPTPNQSAILHLEQLRANIDRAGQADQ